MAAVAGLYRRLLPPPAIDFTCREGKEIFREALEDGTMEGFFKLITNFQTQAEPAFCGLASLSVVLNSLAIDPGRKWKGPWRWFDESMLDCCEPLEKVKAEGITFGKVACLGECSGAHIKAIRANNSSLDQFRQLVKECAASESQHMIASYNRQVLNQTGSGHFSPIGGYHGGKDMALILDVARFKYPAHWVPLNILWDAVNSIDASTGNWRGFMIITKRDQPPSQLFTLSCRGESWRDVFSYLFRDLPKALEGTVTGFVKWIAEVRTSSERSNLESEESQRLNDKATLLDQLRSTELYAQLGKWLRSTCQCPLSGNDLTDDVSEACCQAAAVLSGGAYQVARCFTCKQSCQTGGIATIVTGESNYDSLKVAGHVMSNGTKDGIQVLVPTASESACAGTCLSHPMSVDIFAILLFALPAETWLGIQNADLQSTFGKLLSTAELPDFLQLEIQHLHRQLQLLDCGDEKQHRDKHE